MWGGYLVALYTFVKFGVEGLQKIAEESTRLITKFANINGVAMVTAMAITIAVYFWLNEGAVLSTLMAIPAIIILMLSGSRTALIQAIFGIFCVILFKNWTGNKVKAIFKTLFFVSIFVIILLIVAKLPIFEGMAERMEGLIASFTGEGKIDHSTMVRNKLTTLGYELFFQNPVCGVGVNNARLFTSHVIGVTTYLHSNYAELLADGGIVGFTIYYGIYAYLLIKLFSRRKERLGPAIIVMLLSLLLADFGTVSYYDKATYFYLMIAFVYLKELPKKEEESFNADQTTSGKSSKVSW